MDVVYLQPAKTFGRLTGRQGRLYVQVIEHTGFVTFMDLFVNLFHILDGIAT